MHVTQNSSLNMAETDISLQLLAGGDALCDSEWTASEPAPPYTRLYYIVDGEAAIQTEQGRLPLIKGNLYLLPTGYPFSYTCDGQMRQLYFHVRLVGNDGFDRLRGIPHLLQTPVNEAYLQQLLTLYASQVATDWLHLKSLLARDVFALLSAYGIELQTPHYSPCITEALRFIDSHLSAALTVGDVANGIFVSPNTLSHKFKREMGVSLGQYMDSLLLFKAKNLLQHTNLPLSTISEQLGFCDQFYFSRRFREHFNVPPLKYRKRHR